MKQLFLIRHGKSSWQHGLADKDRPLQERGRTDAQRVAKKCKELGIILNAAYTSPAKRALHTSTLFVNILDFPTENVEVVEALYDFSGEKVQAFVEALDNIHNTIAIFGHNYALTALANKWGNQYIEHVPTAGLICVAFEVQDWAAITKGVTQHLLFPKHLKP